MSLFNRAVSVTELSWFWIALLATAAPLAGSLIALPCWLKSQPLLGNIAGSAVIFGSALVLIIRESVEIDRITRGCLDAGYTCFATPSAFARYAIYAFIALFEVFALFTVSLSVEQKIRRRGYDPEWR
ncbi:MAG: hypothetical protein JWL71_1587 [Acidobacteria bacterium]|jgi:hypothetical protein|nr:hypothetical protein [Acidobacteriota bacterium]